VGLPSLPAFLTRTLRVPVVCEPGQFACDSDVCRDGEWRPTTEQGRALCSSAQVLMVRSMLHSQHALMQQLPLHSQAVVWLRGVEEQLVLSPWLGALLEN